MNILTLHRDSDGISPYLQCPWCSYADVIGEFSEYHHPNESREVATGSTECGQCLAAGPTAMFVLAYDPGAPLGESEQYRELYISLLYSTPG